MSKLFYKPTSRSPGYIRPTAIIHASSAGKVTKSRSYLAKLREKQDQLARENAVSVNEPIRSEEATEKPFTFCEKSITRSDASLEKNPSILAPEDEEILNIIRLEQPKAELRSSPKLCSCKYPSPIKPYIPSEKCEEAEKELLNQRAKYRRLEAQYNEILSKNTHIELFYKGIIENLNKELLKPDNQPTDPILESLNSELNSLKTKFLQIETKSSLIEQIINSKKKVSKNL
ncbi:hypothetical protein SteCoe_36729 [Stentor coeruleus]|uniref:Uncharacterized protein n=1 Tax=Stentor coeruleus TaxID=5963 RepID=A0A1R2APF2_9CILI|nr:hypothetical protein SteCoe_36729 [Stentor coeruleus]